MTFVVSLNWLRRFVPMRMEKNYGSPPYDQVYWRVPLWKRILTSWDGGSPFSILLISPVPVRRFYGCFFLSINFARTENDIDTGVFPFDQFRPHRKWHWHGCFFLLINFARTENVIGTGAFFFCSVSPVRIAIFLRVFSSFGVFTRTRHRIISF